MRLYSHSNSPVILTSAYFKLLSYSVLIPESISVQLSRTIITLGQAPLLIFAEIHLRISRQFQSCTSDLSSCSPGVPGSWHFPLPLRVPQPSTSVRTKLGSAPTILTIQVVMTIYSVGLTALSRQNCQKDRARIGPLHHQGSDSIGAQVGIAQGFWCFIQRRIAKKAMNWGPSTISRGMMVSAFC